MEEGRSSVTTVTSSALVVVKPESDTTHQASSNYDVSLRVFTRLNNPTSLSATFDGDSTHLTWQNEDARLLTSS